MNNTLMAPVKVSQKDQIRSYLNQFDVQTGRRRGITALEALGLFRIFRLAARIEELRQDGLDIITEVKTDTTGKKFARYYLNVRRV